MAHILNTPYILNPPLAGKTVLVTRPREQATELQLPLEILGIDFVYQPAIEILPSSQPDDFDDALRSIVEKRVDWAVFSSGNGVRATFGRLGMLYSLLSLECGDLWKRSGVKIAVVGEGTGKTLSLYGLKPDVVPKRFDAEGLVEALDEVVKDYPSQRFVSFRASRGRQVLADAAKERGAQWREVEAYRSVDVEKPSRAVVEQLQSGKFDAAVVTSSASAESLARMFGDDMHKTRWVAISPLTAKAMEDLGVPVAKIAEEATMDSLGHAVVDVITEHN